MVTYCPRLLGCYRKAGTTIYLGRMVDTDTGTRCRGYIYITRNILILLLRGTLENRTYGTDGTDKNIHTFLFSLTIRGYSYYGLP